MRLRYGMNPQQATAHATLVTRSCHPVRVVHGQPSLINMLDALNAWRRSPSRSRNRSRR